MPKRCPFAPENTKFSQEIRQFIYGKGRNAYRILFTVLDQQNLPTVVAHLNWWVRLSRDKSSKALAVLGFVPQPNLLSKTPF
ncbi:MAG: hypothetical protein AAGG51_29310 [Cyanobacteria bacterium P01_G01_bin.54]